MSAGNPISAAVLSSIDKVVASFAAEGELQHVRDCTRLAQEVISRLPHKYLPAATYSEIRAAERLLQREGRTRKELRLQRSTLASLLDQLVLDGVMRWHPLRGEDRKQANPVSLPRVVLTAALPPAIAQTITDQVEPLGFTLHSEVSVEAALDRAAWIPFSFVFSAYPIAAPAWLLDTLRGPSSLCRNAGVVLVSADDHVEQAVVHLGRGANRVVALSHLKDQLVGAITELGQVSERVRLRVPVQIERKRCRRVESWCCENISRTGMLLRTSSSLRTGAIVDLQFLPPRSERPIRASAQVVRTTTFGREDFNGYGICFLGFYADGQYRLERFLQ
jgi:hypothetical protein